MKNNGAGHVGTREVCSKERTATLVWSCEMNERLQQSERDCNGLPSIEEIENDRISPGEIRSEKVLNSSTGHVVPVEFAFQQ